MKRWALGFAIAAAALGSCSARSPESAPAAAGGEARFEPFADGFGDPVHLTAPPSDPRIFVVEQGGTVRAIENGRPRRKPFLDLTDRVRSGGEQGLLCLAFHPRYRDNGFLYVNYTDRDGNTRIERFTAGSDPDRIDPATGKLILAVDQPYSNHNGGQVLFGPDSMLYVPLGDGGSGGDPQGNGQNPEALLGKLLRIDVDRGDPYAVPPDNPWVGRAGARPEVWARGLRNPWRIAFDAAGGLLYIADVGQNRWEEIHVARAGAGGLNYGWNLLEGSHCFRRPGCDQPGLERPALEYSHREGCSVTGGEVYRGRGLPELSGVYFYADYCQGWIRSFRWRDGRVTEPRTWPLPDALPISSFGTDAAGELYAVSHGGEILKLVRVGARAGD